jgi:2-polyprenyl-6-methoxyphenol hydroxylase-like FAD-dependent oxidoreductase
MTTALVFGASVAGLATAYWLEQHGYNVVRSIELMEY